MVIVRNGVVNLTRSDFLQFYDDTLLHRASGKSRCRQKTRGRVIFNLVFIKPPLRLTMSGGYNTIVRKVLYRRQKELDIHLMTLVTTMTRLHLNSSYYHRFAFIRIFSLLLNLPILSVH